MTIEILESYKKHEKYSLDPILSACWLFSIFALTFSYYHEFFLKIKPCYFCEIQRIPFFLMIFIIPLRQSIAKKEWVKIVTLICLFLSAFLAIWHSLIQTGYIADSCITPKIDSIENFQKTLESQTPCSKSSWIFLGFPISFYNAAISFVLSCLLGANIIKKKLTSN